MVNQWQTYQRSTQLSRMLSCTQRFKYTHYTHACVSKRIFSFVDNIWQLSGSPALSWLELQSPDGNGCLKHWLIGSMAQCALFETGHSSTVHCLSIRISLFFPTDFPKISTRTPCDTLLWGAHSLTYFSNFFQTCLPKHFLKMSRHTMSPFHF